MMNGSTKSNVPRWRWWIHFALIGGYILPGVLRGLYFVPQRPVLTGSARGLLVVCGFNLGAFAVVFLLGWLASHATAEELFLPWRQGWWVLPLGIGYSIAFRVILAVVGMITILFLVITHLVDVDSLRNVAVQIRPRVDHLVDFSALQTNRIYYWLVLTLVSFVGAGSVRNCGELTLAGMRALWPRAFLSPTGEVIAIVVIAIGFGAAHLSMGSLAAAVATLLGLFLELILIVHRSIWPAVIAHGFFDATTFALLPLVASRVPHPHP